MKIDEILFEVQSRGIELMAAAGKLRYRPIELADTELVARLREQKAELIEFLIRDEGAEFGLCFECQIPLLGAQTFDGFVNRTCQACGRCYRCTTPDIIQFND